MVKNDRLVYARGFGYRDLETCEPVGPDTRFYLKSTTKSFTGMVAALLHEEGPTRDLTLQWATYHDAADQAGLSRLAGGIHVPEDDVEGRIVGAECGERAWELAQRYFDGTARP